MYFRSAAADTESSPLKQKKQTTPHPTKPVQRKRIKNNIGQNLQNLDLAVTFL